MISEQDREAIFQKLNALLDKFYRKDHGAWNGPYAEGYDSAIEDIREELEKVI